MPSILFEILDISIKNPKIIHTHIVNKYIFSKFTSHKTVCMNQKQCS